MPQPASALGKFNYLRLLVLGFPKSGKTTCCVTTAPGSDPADKGRVYVINCDQKDSLKPAQRRNERFLWDYVEDPEDMDKCLYEARKGVKAGEIETVILDTISGYFPILLDDCMEQSKGRSNLPDPRKAWPESNKRILALLKQLFSLRCHVIVISHYEDKKSDEEQKTKRQIIPLISGKAATSIPAQFQDIVFFELYGSKRVFTTSIEGTLGPGCRSLDGYHTVKADVRLLIRSFSKGSVVEESKVEVDESERKTEADVETSVKVKKKKKSLPDGD